MTDEQAQEAMRVLDLDQSGTVEFEEFQAWWNSDSSNPNLQRLKHAQATLGSIEGSGALFG